MTACKVAAPLAVALMMLLGCSSKQAATPEPVVSVQTATVQRKSVQRVITSNALLYPINQVTIVPKISAPIRKFYVERGSHVKAGQLVAVLDNKDLSAAVVENQGAYEQAQAAYATSTEVNLPAQIQAAELNVKATKQAMEADQAVYRSRLKLYKSGAMARNLMNQSHVTYIQANNQYEIAQAKLKALQAVGKTQQMKAAQGQLKSAKGRYLAAQAQFKYSRIQSPISGVVTDRPLYEGEMASAGTP
ncbi:MAG TPA: biotin/lipoyl-binding protein, partial [Bryobacteraceae bacterium]